MTVGELIRKLRAESPDAEVELLGEGEVSTSPLLAVEREDDGRVILCGDDPED